MNRREYDIGVANAANYIDQRDCRPLFHRSQVLHCPSQVSSENLASDRRFLSAIFSIEDIYEFHPKRRLLRREIFSIRADLYQSQGPS